MVSWMTTVLVILIGLIIIVAIMLLMTNKRERKNRTPRRHEAHKASPSKSRTTTAQEAVRRCVQEGQARKIIADSAAKRVVYRERVIDPAVLEVIFRYGSFCMKSGMKEGKRKAM